MATPYSYGYLLQLWIPLRAMATSYSYGYPLQLWLPLQLWIPPSYSYSYGYPLQPFLLVMRELATCIGHEPTTRYRDYSEAVIPVFSADQERTFHSLPELIRSFPSQLPALSRRLHLLPEFVRSLPSQLPLRPLSHQSHISCPMLGKMPPFQPGGRCGQFCWLVMRQEGCTVALITCPGTAKRAWIRPPSRRPACTAHRG